MQRFKKILVVVDPRASSKATLNRAAQMAQRNKARLTVVDVIEDLPRDAHMLITAMPPQELQDLVIRERHRQIKTAIEPIRQHGIRITTKVLVGTPSLEIIREVLRSNHDLVMMTAEGPGGLKEMLFGSTTMHLMRECPCPVWVMKPTRRKQFARILAAIDPTPTDPVRNTLNKKILDLATSVAEVERSELHIVHAWMLYGESVLRGRGGLPTTELNRFAHETAQVHQTWLDELLSPYKLENRPHRVHLVKGEAWIVIPEVAQKEAVDLIVMGTVCRTGVAGFLIGNTAEKVLRQVDCSVLTVKPDGFVTPVELNEEDDNRVKRNA